MFNCKAIVAYKNHLHNILVRFQLDRTVNSAFVSKCNYLSIIETNSLFSTTASTSNFTCASSDVIYPITCKKYYIHVQQDG